LNTQQKERTATPPYAAAAQGVGSNTNKDNLKGGKKKSQAKKKACTGGDCSFYFENADPCIGVESCGTSEHIEITINDDDLLLSVIIPRKSLEKLLIAGLKFAESGKRSSFCGGKFFFGECGKQEMFPEEKILKGGF